MKKILLFASALAGLFLAASCQQETLEPVQQGNTVTYTVTVPDALATKGIGDNVANVNTLHYEVYRTAAAKEIEFSDVDNLLYHKTATVTNGTAKIELELVNDQNFTVLFWAQVGETNEAYDVTDLTNVTLKSSVNANQVDYAAFSGVDFVEGTDALTDKTIELTRPVAQINLGTTQASLTAFDEAVVLGGSSMTVAGLSNTFDVAKQAASADLESTTVYAEKVVPTEKLTVNSTDYVYVGMNYVGFAPEVGAPVTVSYDINTTEGHIQNTIENVPVKPNYRTNIIGNLITSKTAYTIELDETWGGVVDEIEIWDGNFISAPVKNAEGKYEVTKPSELAWLAAAVNGTIETKSTEPAMSFNGETFILTENIDLGNFPWTPIGLNGDKNGFQGTFDGNGKTISNLYVDLSAERKYQSAGLFGSANGGTIKNFTVKNATIKNLDVINDSSNGTAVVVGAAQHGLTVENVHVINANVTANKRAAGIVGYMTGSIKNCSVDGFVAFVTPDETAGGAYDNGDKAAAILAYDNNGVEIDGCIVKNAHIEGYRDLGGIAGVARKSITNCTLENVDIVHNPLNGYKTSVDTFGAIHSGRVTPSGDVTTGNQVINVTIYAPENVTIVKPGESLQAAIDAAAVPAVIYLAEGTHTGHTVINKELTLLSVEGANVVYDGHIHINNTTAVIKNITLTNEHASTTTVQASGDAHLSCASSYGSNVTFDNCTFDVKKDPTATRAQYGFYNYQGVSEKIVLKNCTFNCNGERPLYTRTIVEVDGCKFYDQYRYAIQVAGELPAQQQVVTFTNNQIINPCVTSGKAFAAGISISGSRTCENVTFNISGNTLTSPLFNELIYVYDNSAKINIASCTVNGATFVREDKVPNTYAAYTDEDLIDAEEGAVLVLQNDMDLNFTGVNPQYNPIKASVIDLNGKTLTIKKTDIRYYNNTTIKNGNIVVDPSVSSSTAIFYMHDDYTLTLDGVKVVATGVGGTYIFGLEGTSDLNLIDSEILIDNPSLVNLTAAFACNGSGMTTVKNSDIYVKNINGRAFLNTSCSVENSTVTADYVKAGFYIPNGKMLSIDATSTVTITNLVDGKVNGIDLYGNAEYNVEEGATVSATVGRN